MRVVRPKEREFGRDGMNEHLGKSTGMMAVGGVVVV